MPIMAAIRLNMMRLRPWLFSAANTSYRAGVGVVKYFILQSAGAKRCFEWPFFGVNPSRGLLADHAQVACHAQPPPVLLYPRIREPSVVRERFSVLRAFLACSSRHHHGISVLVQFHPLGHFLRQLDRHIFDRIQKLALV